MVLPEKFLVSGGEHKRGQILLDFVAEDVARHSTRSLAPAATSEKQCMAAGTNPEGRQ